MPRAIASPYIEWSKLESHSAWSLAPSGVATPPREMLLPAEELEVNGPSSYGYPPLVAAIASRYDAPGDAVVTTLGCSMANHLVMAALVEPGDEVLVEQPAYEPLVATASFLGARVTRVARRPDAGCRLDPGDVANALTPATRLVVLANLHNPTSHLLDTDTLAAIGSAADRVGARVLVDEVYLDAVFDRRPPSAFALGPQFISTNSLTKVYGLNGLRCGWLIADPPLARRIRRLDDLFGITPVHAGHLLSLRAFDRLDAFAARSRALLGANRALVDAFVATRDDVFLDRPEYGTTVFLRYERGDVETLYRLLRQRYDTTIVPGRYFEAPDHFRIGIGSPTATLREGLDRLGRALDDLDA
jgi:aspartate/methionine/tyrosine aminotransferase